MISRPQQLTLSVTLGSDFDFPGFVVGENADVIDAVRITATHSQFSYVWGREGSGRTHLLHAACREAANAGRRTGLLPARDALAWQPEVVDGWESFDLVVVDDIHSIAGNPDWERAVFNLYNSLRDAGASLLVSANAPPASLEIALADLKSRLGAMLVYQLHSLGDEQRLEALIRKARARGLELPEETGRYLLSRVARDMHHLVALLDRLDNASLAHQRRLTIPFVRDLLDAQ